MVVRLTIERLREVLDYNPCTGKFIWKIQPNGRVFIGSEAGTIEKGYIRIQIDKRIYRAHRLAWFYVHGVWPSKLIDHKDQNKTHNWLTNLRDASDSQNKINSNAPKNNTSGIKGVSWNKYNNKWAARLANKHLGYFSSKDEAAEVYLYKAKEVYGEFVPQ